jgi:hypothetical protein
MHKNSTGSIRAVPSFLRFDFSAKAALSRQPVRLLGPRLLNLPVFGQDKN